MGAGPESSYTKVRVDQSGGAGQGALLCLVGRRMEMLESVATSARKFATKVECFQSDLTADESFREIPDRVK
jgi:short-subunit dehydrogenase